MNADGLIEKYRENLLLQSNQFDTTWTTYLASVTSGQNGYDGTNDAWLLSKSGASGQIRQNVTSSGVATFSVYAKANGSDYAQMVSGSVYQFFNLSLGTLGAGSGISGSIEAVGTNGWYRISMSFDSSITSVRLYPAEVNTTSGTTGSIYIQNAQLENGLVATDYLDSGATTAKAGVLIDLPRINYDANGENGALLLEPSRANLVQYSEYFGDSSWDTGATTADISKSPNLSPEGVANCYYVENVSGGQLGFYTTITSGASYTGSFWVRKVSGSGVVRMLNVNNSSTDFNVDTEWTRVSVTATSTSTTGRCYVQARNTGDIIEVYGAQLEAGSYATSYIPNHGSSGGVTRAADSCLDGGSAESINSTEGVLYAEISALAEDVSFKTICLHDGTNTQRINIWYWNDGTFKVDGHNNNVQQFNFDFAADLTALNKIAVKYKANDFSVFLNGSKINSDTSGATPIGLNTLDFRNGNNLYPFYGNVKQVAVFDEALSDSELATLTTL